MDFKSSRHGSTVSSPTSFILCPACMGNLIFLLIEYLDELVFSLQEAAWPLIRNDLVLNYIQIGVLLSLPGIIGNFIEPEIFILSDLWRKRIIILAGGFFFALSLCLVALSHSAGVLLVALIIFSPASGAFVSLSQAVLMDSDPSQHEPSMARWTFAGSLGVFMGPLLLGALIAIGWGWRSVFWLLALVACLVWLAAYKLIPGTRRFAGAFPSIRDFKHSFHSLLAFVREGSVLRWLILLEFSDLMLDVFYGFLALYLVDVAGLNLVTAAFAVGVWTGVGLVGDLLLIPLVERVRGLDYLRLSVVAELILFPAFLLVSITWVKLIVLGLLGLFNSGWYAILKANLFSSLPGKSGTVQALDNLSGLVGKFLPFLIGVAAQSLGLGIAMWFLIAGPLALFFGLPRKPKAPMLNS